MDGKEGAQRLKFESLELFEAGVSKRKQHNQFLLMEEFPFRDVERSMQEQHMMDYCIAVRTKMKILGETAEEDIEESRIVGTLWGRQSSVRKDIFEICVLATDESFRGAAEFWLMDNLRADMRKHGWKFLAVRIPLEADSHPLARVEDLHGFRPKDIKDKKAIYEWSERGNDSPSDY